MVKLAGSFSKIGKCKVMVVGDLCLDTYTLGKASRISPEAPVAVVRVISKEHRPGMAGNVALNFRSLGSDVVIVGRVGVDDAASELKRALVAEGVDISGVLEQEGVPTPVKERIIAQNQQIVRVDHETVTPLSPEIEQQLVAKLPTLFDDVKVVAISDYAKGTLSRGLLKEVIGYARERNIPVVADPKGVDFSKYAGATVVKPNLGEAYAAANLEAGASLDSVAESIFGRVAMEYLMITRSEEGISVFSREGERLDFPVHGKEVQDVTGAGDTVLAMLACALGNRCNISEAAQLANVAAGIAIEHLGCVRVSLSQLAQRLLDTSVDNKVFEEKHLFALQGALKDRSCAVVAVSTRDGIDADLLRTLHDLGNSHDGDVVVYIEDDQPDQGVVNILASMQQVSFVIVKGQGISHLSQWLQPTKIIDALPTR